MSLLTDVGVIDESDLRLRDSSILDVSSQEQVDLRAKIALAQSEIKERIEYLLRACPAATGITADNVVMTEGLTRWLAYYTLEMVYQDVHFSQLNDRYGRRWEEYRRRASEAEHDYAAQGVGISSAPLPQPAAPLAQLDAGGLAPATYHLQTRWVNAKGEESAPSPIATISASSFHSLRVAAGVPPGSATGWNVYAGATEETICRQNSAALAVGQQWVHVTGELEAAAEERQSQKPSSYVYPKQEMRRRY